MSHFADLLEMDTSTRSGPDFAVDKARKEKIKCCPTPLCARESRTADPFGNPRQLQTDSADVYGSVRDILCSKAAICKWRDQPTLAVDKRGNPTASAVGF
jgi:hypothetical protein